MAPATSQHRNIPRPLIERFRDGKGVVFVGAGVSQAAGLIGWSKLVEEFRTRLHPPIPPRPEKTLSTDDLTAIPQYYVNQTNRGELNYIMDHNFKNKRIKVSLVHGALCRLPTDTFYTTNFDEVLELELRKQYNTDVIWNDSTARTSSGGTKVVRKIHGSIADHESIVLTRTDYAKFSMSNKLMIEELRDHLRRRTFLFIGYSLRDPDFNSIYDAVFLDHSDYMTHYIALSESNEHQRVDLNERGIKCIDLEPWGDKSDLSLQLEAFLKQLADETTSRHHMDDFYAPLEPDSVVKIVVSSWKTLEECFSIPAADTHTAQQIGADLNRCGRRFEILPAQHVMDAGDTFLQQDFILVCGPGNPPPDGQGLGPYGNQVTSMLFKEFAKGTFGISCRFERSDHLVRGSTTYTSSEAPIGGAGGSGPWTEYGLIARYPNPWAESKHVFVFAGIRAIGTHLIGKFLKSNFGSAYADLTRDATAGRPIEHIVRFVYDAYEPVHFTWKANEPPEIR